MPRTEIKSEVHDYNAVWPDDLFQEVKKIAQVSTASEQSVVLTFLKWKKMIDAARTEQAGLGKPADIKVAEKIILPEFELGRYTSAQDFRKKLVFRPDHFTEYATLAKAQGIDMVTYVRLATAMGVAMMQAALTKKTDTELLIDGLHFQVGEKHYVTYVP